MSINDPIHIKWHDKKHFWYVSQGRETFYDENDCLYMFETGEQALAWAMENLPANLIEANFKQPTLFKE